MKPSSVALCIIRDACSSVRDVLDTPVACSHFHLDGNPRASSIVSCDIALSVIRQIIRERLQGHIYGRCFLQLGSQGDLLAAVVGRLPMPIEATRTLRLSFPSLSCDYLACVLCVAKRTYFGYGKIFLFVRFVLGSSALAFPSMIRKNEHSILYVRHDPAAQ